MGWWERLQQTHRPVTDIKDHPILGHHRDLLERHRFGLVSDVEVLEKLAPGRPDAKKLDEATAANPEYPFFYVERDSTTGVDVPRLIGPGTYFTETVSRGHYLAARDVLLAYQDLNHTNPDWQDPLPGPL
jgi:hypothetical protein